VLSKWIYVLIGNDRTGKTTFQKRVAYHLCGQAYERLPANTLLDITHKYAPKKLNNVSLINRSFQEKKGEYKSIENYFSKYFKAADICFLSSHANSSCVAEITEIISQAKIRKYNVGGVFFSNAENAYTQDIALLDWGERFYLENPIINNPSKIDQQIDGLAWEFSEMLVRRAYHQ